MEDINLSMDEGYKMKCQKYVINGRYKFEQYWTEQYETSSIIKAAVVFMVFLKKYDFAEGYKIKQWG